MSYGVDLVDLYRRSANYVDRILKGVQPSVVFALVADPVGAGWVESLARPGGNTTGFLGAKLTANPMTRSLHPPMTTCGHRVRFVATWREEFFEVPLCLWGRYIHTFSGIVTSPFGQRHGRARLRWSAVVTRPWWPIFCSTRAWRNW